MKLLRTLGHAMGKAGLLWIAIGMLLALVLGASAEDSPSLSWIEALTSKTADQKNTVNAARLERAHAIAALRDTIGLADTAEDRPRIAAAMQIAGVLRTSELVEPLLDHITFLEYGVIPATRPVDPRDLRGEYIPLRALTEIGLPAVKPALDRLARENDTKARILYAQVVKFVAGPEVAELLLKQAVERATGADKDRLIAVRELLVR